MINAEQIREILSLYKKHGWNLSRVLLSTDLKNSLAKEEINKLFENTEIFESKVNAAWFCRASKNNRTAWELRHLNMNPYALIEFFDEDEDESSKEKKRKSLENRLETYASKRLRNKKG